MGVFSPGTHLHHSMRMSQNIPHENFADYDETKVHTKVMMLLSDLQEPAYLK